MGRAVAERVTRGFRSPLRGPWLTAALGSVLLVLVTIVAVTGFLSHAAYEPDLRGNAIIPVDADLPLTFGWPTSPTWLYAVNQSLHVNVGLVAVPVLLAKLWSVIPRLFVWPPVTSARQGIERIGIALLVASAIFQFATGIVNTQYWYAFHFNFVVAHYYGAVVFVGALFLHVLVKLPTIARAYRDRGWIKPLRDDLASTRPEPDGDLVARDPAPPTLSRRGLFAFVGGASLTLLVANAGESIGGPLRSLAFLAPRREDFPVNKTAARAGITPEMVGPAYLLTLSDGAREIPLTLDELRALPQHTATAADRLRGGLDDDPDLDRRAAVRARAGRRRGRGAQRVRALAAAKGVLSKASLSADAIADPDSLLALQVNGRDLPLDHGYPARIIVPALPGVHNTKWVGSIEFA